MTMWSSRVEWVPLWEKVVCVERDHLTFPTGYTCTAHLPLSPRWLWMHACLSVSELTSGTRTRMWRETWLSHHGLPTSTHASVHPLERHGWRERKQHLTSFQETWEMLSLQMTGWHLFCHHHCHRSSPSFTFRDTVLPKINAHTVHQLDFAPWRHC